MADVPLMSNPMTTAGDMIQGGASGAPTRLALGTAGQVPTVNAGATALEYQTPAAGSGSAELDYVQFTSNVSPTATTEAGANTVVTGSSVAYDGSTAVMIEFFSPVARSDAGAAGRTLNIFLFEDGSSLGFIGQISTPTSAGTLQVLNCKRRLTPSNGNHTYSIRASVSAGTGFIGAGAGGVGNNVPGFIRITEA